MRLALFEPDIPQNLGAFIRLSACLKVPLDVIEPCGFPSTTSASAAPRTDYYDLASIARHASWAAFNRATGRPAGRLVLLTTKGATDFPASPSQGRHPAVRPRECGRARRGARAADLRLRIPLQKGARSLNVALAAAMVVSEALRQTSGFDALSD